MPARLLGDPVGLGGVETLPKIGRLGPGEPRLDEVAIEIVLLEYAPRLGEVKVERQVGSELERFAVIAKDEVRDQLRLGGMMFGGFLASAVVLGWLMYPFPL